MKSKNTFGNGLLIALLGLALSGCPDYPDTSPGKDARNVPVDAIVHVGYVTESPIDEAEITEETIHISLDNGNQSDGTKKSAEEKKSTTADSKSDDTSKDKKKEPAETAATPSPQIDGHFEFKSGTGTSESGEKLYIKDIFYIPKVAANTKSFLIPGASYRIDIAAIPMENGKETAPDTIKFTAAPKTEREGQISFVKEPVAAIINADKALSPQDTILVKFNGPVNPTRVLATQLCTDLSKGVQYNYDPEKVSACDGSAKAGLVIYQIEQLTRDKNNFVRLKNNTFGLISKGSIKSPFESTLSNSKQAKSERSHFIKGNNYTLDIRLSPVTKKEGSTAADFQPDMEGTSSFTVDSDKSAPSISEVIRDDLGLKPELTHVFPVN